jgi:hypothetical protein
MASYSYRQVGTISQPINVVFLQLDLSTIRTERVALIIASFEHQAILPYRDS